ncbi:hypothetical protein [uncultured Cloacibacillus sp.]|uniref:hypothetical protein n=1 Tax=uncultured Cloacibacillus sp. TaxID=889794 RepID=UPI00320A1E9B
MAFECNFDFLSPEQNERLAAFINEMREFSDKGGEVIRLSRELRAVTKERDNYKAMLSGASKACEDLRREYMAYRDGVAAAAENVREAAELSAALERWRIEAEDFRERLKCANAEIARLREEAETREDSAASVEKTREKYEKKIAVLEDRLRGYRDYAKRMARMAATSPEEKEDICDG